MAKETFFLSDLHLGHANILKLEPDNRAGVNINEHNELIIESVNSRVSSKDTLWLLGDLCWTAKEIPLLRRMNGVKCIILGNHDKFPVGNYTAFGEIFPSLWKFQGFWLSHCPIHPNELRGRPNIHGHVHSQSIERRGPPGGLDHRYFNVSVDVTGGLPIHFDDIQEFTTNVPV